MNFKQKSKKFIFSAMICLFISSCTKTYDLDKCNTLSMNSFKGSPVALNRFEKNCQDIEVTYTHQICQAALEDLVSTGSLGKIKELYGNDVSGCFTQNDLNNFNKDE